MGWGNIPLGKNETIPVFVSGLLGVNSQLILIQTGKIVCSGKTSSGLPGFGAVYWFEDALTHPDGKQL